MEPLNFSGLVYSNFKIRQNYSEDDHRCITSTVTDLLNQSTTNEHPGMLLGKVQSGKTKTFLGVIALAFDNGFDAAIVLTKGTRALAQQTLARLNKEFKPENDSDLLHIFDVMSLPEPLAEYELAHKLVIVCKKEDDNLRRLDTAFFHTNPVLSDRRILIIDDEADYASIGFRRSRQEGIKMNKIASQIDDLRKRMPQVSFLQVTATPYSLYLQPSQPTTPANQQVFLPTRPAFTQLVPVHSRYVGGEYYFVESLEQESVASFLHVPVDANELDILKERDRRRFRIEDCLTSPSIESLRRAIITFIVGGWIRRWQNERENKPAQKYSFIVHTETRRASHQWQEDIVAELIARLKTAAKSGNPIVRTLISEVHADLSQSVQLLRLPMPSIDEIVTNLGDALRMVNSTRVNSEKDVLAMLDETGQLKLRTPFNIFIGGQILDRGLTIANLIGFFYGRSPQRFQQDTVLQHSRMYGVRPQEDLAVTRFYTTRDIYSAMNAIHTFDTALRHEFEQHGHEAGIVFLRADPRGQIIPCSPNKILLSTVTTVSPGARFLPVGFSTDAKSRAIPQVRAIDELLTVNAPSASEDPFVIDTGTAERIVDHVHASLVMDPGFNWDAKAFKAMLRHLARENPNSAQRGEVACLVRRNRDLAKVRPGGRLQTAPDSLVERRVIEQSQEGRPALLLYRQNGKHENGWNDCEFWWPVLRAPSNVKTVIFASDTVD